MALDAATIWEFRSTATANMVNGGGFNATRDVVNGVDYSQQDTAQLTATDLTCTAASTTITSATGGFTHAMEGNIIHLTALTGTGSIVGWYEIVTWTDTNNVVLDRTPTDGANNITAGTFYVGGSLNVGNSLEDDFFDSLVAGNIVYVKGAVTYTPSEAISTVVDGTTASPITIEGYNTTRGDNPIGANRPTIALGANSITVDNYWIFKNFIMTTTAAIGLSLDNGSIAENIFLTNSSETVNRSGLYSGDVDAFFVNCEAVSTVGYAIRFNTNHNRLFGCYMHDSTAGIYVGASYGNRIFFNIIDTCTTGYAATGNTGNTQFINNTVYNCSTAGFSGNVTDKATIINNIFDTCGTGITFTSQYNSNYADSNNFNGNSTNRTNIAVGDHDTAVDPGFVDAANGNFAITGAI